MAQHYKCPHFFFTNHSTLLFNIAKKEEKKRERKRERKGIYVKDVAWKRISEYFVWSKWAVCVRV